MGESPDADTVKSTVAHTDIISTIANRLYERNSNTDQEDDA